MSFNKQDGASPAVHVTRHS